MCNKKYYEITEDCIKFFNGKELVFTLNKTDIVNMVYTRFRWLFLLDYGAGELNIEYVEHDDIKPNLVMKDGLKIYIMYASYKQVVKISEIMKIPLSTK